MLLVHEPDKQALNLVLFDQQDFVAEDKVIGHATLPVKDMAEGQTVEEWIPLESAGSFKFGNPVTMGIQVTPDCLPLLCSQKLLLWSFVGNWANRKHFAIVYVRDYLLIVKQRKNLLVAHFSCNGQSSHFASQFQLPNSWAQCIVSTLMCEPKLEFLWQGVQTVRDVARDAIHLPFNLKGRKQPELHIQMTYHEIEEADVRAAKRGDSNIQVTMHKSSGPSKRPQSSLGWNPFTELMFLIL